MIELDQIKTELGNLAGPLKELEASLGVTEKEQRIEDMLDLFDDYEDESTEEHEQSAASLFRDLQGELEKNGFLSTMLKAATEAETMEKTADTVKKNMGNESARVIAMEPIESE